MPSYARQKTLDERVAILEERLAKLERSGSVVDDINLFRVGFENYNYDDSPSLNTIFENWFTPRGGRLTLGLTFYGDQVGTSPAVNTGGAWTILLNSVVAASGTVPATFTLTDAYVVLDISPYLGQNTLHLEVQTQRTSGATTGGRYGGGGCIGSAVHQARIN
ncbi:hypothetical protein [Actinacidiphila sp. ITFR-21]|uniref:hypothetical protein n=1 Tax=Actinacidiphila sp. ITFR-21 TaxID=3075199 RepID=UPI00288BD594|nr:hypothetical protein [Streptomyces sp. ITFR-21]WNI15582.1 hypothetical protein RLT57_08605 [Streptomyces sp. ITFR-21]